MVATFLSISYKINTRTKYHNKTLVGCFIYTHACSCKDDCVWLCARVFVLEHKCFLISITNCGCCVCACMARCPVWIVSWGKLNFQLSVCAGIALHRACKLTYNANWFCLMNIHAWINVYLHMYIYVQVSRFVNRILRSMYKPIPRCTWCYYSAIPQDLSATDIVIVQWNCSCIHKCAVANGCSWQHVLVYLLP